jgi:hypothetical protein
VVNTGRGGAVVPDRAGHDRPVTVLLLHSPLLAAAATWGDLPERLGEPAVVPEVVDDGTPPYADRYVAAVVARTRAAAAAPAAAGLAVFAHSGAGPLVAAVAAALGAAGLPVAEAVFVDAGLPPAVATVDGPAAGRPVTRFDLLAAESAEAAAGLRELLDGDGRFPNWTADALVGMAPDPAAVVAGMRPRGADFFAEPLPAQPLPPGVRCGYVQLSATYRSQRDRAAALGWPVAGADLGHFGMLTDAGRVADLIRSVR